MSLIESRIPPHTSFKLEHNPHRVIGSSESLPYYLEVYSNQLWINSEQEEKGRRTNSIWVATIYTLTSVTVVQAADLEELLNYIDPLPRGNING